MIDYTGNDDSGEYLWRGYGGRKNEDMWEKPKFQKDKIGIITLDEHRFIAMEKK